MDNEIFSPENMAAARERANAVHGGGVKVPSRSEQSEVKSKTKDHSDQEDSTSNNNIEPTRAERIKADEKEIQKRLDEKRGSLILPDAALYGIVGRTVETLAKYSISGKENLLCSTLAIAGNMLTRNPHSMVRRDRHGTNIYVVMIGETSTGAKGQGMSLVKDFFKQVDQEYAANNIRGATARSGEGLLDLFTDDRPKNQIMFQPEASSLLTIGKIQGNRHLFDYFKTLWDGVDYEKLAVGNKQDLKDVLFSYLGHITPHAFVNLLDDIEIKDGFINRFFLPWTQMSRPDANPESITWEEPDLKELIQEWKEVLPKARRILEIKRDSDAKEMWRDEYNQGLKQGMGGDSSDVDILARSNPNKLRVANIYAAYDVSHTMEEKHIIPATSVWDYCHTSVIRIFGKGASDPIGKAIMENLKSNSSNVLVKEKGLPLNQITRLFKNKKNVDSEKVNKRLKELTAKNLIRIEKKPSTGGRPTEMVSLVED